jgi:hypothetical protein
MRAVVVLVALLALAAWSVPNGEQRRRRRTPRAESERASWKEHFTPGAAEGLARPRTVAGRRFQSEAARAACLLRGAGCSGVSCSSRSGPPVRRRRPDKETNVTHAGKRERRRERTRTTQTYRPMVHGLCVRATVRSIRPSRCLVCRAWLMPRHVSSSFLCLQQRVRPSAWCPRGCRGGPDRSRFALVDAADALRRVGVGRSR